MSVCNCFGLSPMPASKFPVKRYNYLVPGIFPLTPLAIDEDLPPWIGKKLEKLHEYIQLNPKNTAKVSRRLERRIRSELRSKASVGLGNVKIAVHAYVYLLAHSQAKDVVLYAEELIIKEDPVIEILLKSKSLHLNILGAELLAHFLRKQNEGEYFHRLESMVPIICRLCSSMSKKDVRNHPGAQSSTDYKKLRLELRVACLRSLREHVALMHRLLRPLGEKENNVENIMSCVLDNLGSKETLTRKPYEDKQISENDVRPSSPVGRIIRNGFSQLQQSRNTFLSRKNHVEASTSFDFAFTLRTGNFDEAFMTSDGPSAVAAQVLRELGLLTRAARSAERILTVLLKQLDDRHGWQGTDIVKLSFDVMHEAFGREHQQFLLFRILLKHAARASHLPFPERISLIKIALDEGLAQDSQLAVLVLTHCLDCLHHQLPKPKCDVDNELIPVATDLPNKMDIQEHKTARLCAQHVEMSDEHNEQILRSIILSGIAQIARRVEGSMQLVDTLLLVLSTREQSLTYEDHMHSSNSNLSLFECVLSAAQALSDLPDEGGRLQEKSFDNAIYQLLGMLVELPAAQAVYVQGILRMILLVGPKGKPFTDEQNYSLLSSIYYALKNHANTTYNFSELSAFFYTLMSKSSVTGMIRGLQFIQTIWTEALNESEDSPFYGLPATLLISILFVANQCLVTIGKLLGAPHLSEVGLPFLKEAIDPSLKPSRQFGGVLAYSTGGYNTEVSTRCVKALGQSRKDFKHVKLSNRILDGLKEDNFVAEDSIQDSFEEMIATHFIPEEQLSFLQRQKLGLSRSINAEDSVQGGSGGNAGGEIADVGSVEEWSRRVYRMYNKPNTTRHSDIPSTEGLSSIERLSSGFLDTTSDNNVVRVVQQQQEQQQQDPPEKTRESIARAILASNSDVHDPSKLPDFDMDYPQVGYMP